MVPMLELITEVGAGEAGGYKQLVANVATLITVLNFLVGSAQVSSDWWILTILTSDWSAQCREFYQQQSTGSASPASYLVGVMMTFSWYSYGILRNSGAPLRVLSVLTTCIDQIKTVVDIPTSTIMLTIPTIFS